MYMEEFDANSCFLPRCRGYATVIGSSTVKASVAIVGKFDK
jgi:hypothetical protein